MPQQNNTGVFYMIYEEKQLEEEAVRYTAARMCAAARTAPKGNGIDNIPDGRAYWKRQGGAGR